MKLNQLISLSTDQLQAALPRLLAGNITEPRVASDCERSLQRLVETWDEVVCRRVLDDVRKAGERVRLHPANPHCRVLSRAWAEHVVLDAATAHFERLVQAASRGPVVLVANHASYIDSPLLDALLARSDESLANRVAHVAGPKVYQAVFRRLAIVCLNAIPVQQSAHVARHPSPQPAAMTSRRELAAQVHQTLAATAGVLEEGGLVLLYPEGTRTRDGHMGRFLPGTFRYLRVPHTQVVPLALEGSGKMMGIVGDWVTPRECRLTVGEVIDVAAAGGPRAALSQAERAIAALLPASMRPRSR